ncbi:MAG TPA: hypothetical protein VLB74_00705, partial [Flavobacterium sp.]|nr:hypothetical protein [Flavobacterium sp.]
MAVSITKSYTDNFLKAWLITMLLFFNHTNGQLQSAADCNVSYRICDATQSYYFESNGPGLVDDSYTAFSGSTPYQTIYCIAGNIYPTPEWHPAWFIFTPQYSGEFGFLICPENQTVDWQWALFENPSCTDLSNTVHQLRCNGQPPLAAAEGCTGIGFKNGFGGGATGLGAYINVTAGNTYVLYTSVQQWWLTAP